MNTIHSIVRPRWTAWWGGKYHHKLVYFRKDEPRRICRPHEPIPPTPDPSHDYYFSHNNTTCNECFNRIDK